MEKYEKTKVVKRFIFLITLTHVINYFNNASTR